MLAAMNAKATTTSMSATRAVACGGWVRWIFLAIAALSSLTPTNR
jgi:hypothetical protein